eukprot:TRINITY_DN2814_c0_g1_i1.p1 TRINITY_DN2814_c0_g1~~TRINITY_DN2814_c0_g1_i1.p1  ORF type:complete len:230 (-),score=44.63 TRINITY_DN2814_c0_g1_i1:42-683(-)
MGNAFCNPQPQETHTQSSPPTTTTVIETKTEVVVQEPFSEVLFFPDEKMPCREFLAGKECWRLKKGQTCDYGHDESASLVKFLRYINQAQKTLEVCVFTITCDEISNAVVEAHKRGVQVRVITDDEQMNTQGSDIATFSSQGIPVVHDNSKFHMHHKFAIIDRNLLINGSFNWTRQAVLGNRENIVITASQSLITSFHSHFEKMWQLYATNTV